MKLNLEDLKAKAKRATKGGWFVKQNDKSWSVQFTVSTPFREMRLASGIKSEANAAHIAAASPDVVLALIEQVEKMREVLERISTADAYEEAPIECDWARDCLSSLSQVTNDEGGVG